MKHEHLLDLLLLVLWVWHPWLFLALIFYYVLRGEA